MTGPLQQGGLWDGALVLHAGACRGLHGRCSAEWHSAQWHLARCAASLRLSMPSRFETAQASLVATIGHAHHDCSPATTAKAR